MDKPAEAAEEIELPDYRRGMVDDYESIPFQNIPSLPLKNRYSNTRETETGYTPEQAVEQARRCLVGKRQVEVITSFNRRAPVERGRFIGGRFKQNPAV